MVQSAILTAGDGRGKSSGFIDDLRCALVKYGHSNFEMRGSFVGAGCVSAGLDQDGACQRGENAEISLRHAVNNGHTFAVALSENSAVTGFAL